MQFSSPAPAIKLSIQRMVCEGCGAEANAPCNCGKPYVPKSVRAAEAIAANPEKSNRQIAGEIGADKVIVDRARKKLESAGDVSPPETVTGKDGKQYPTKRPEAEEDDDDDDELTAEQKRKQKQFIERAKAAAKMGGYEGPIDSEMQEAAATVADAWVPYAGINRKWKTRWDGYADLSRQIRKLEERNSNLTAALNAKEVQEGRNWPADITPKQIKRRDKCLSNIAYWQRELEQLHGEVTGQPSWRVEFTTKDGVRMGNEVRFGTRGEAEFCQTHYVTNEEDPASSEVIACKDEKANVSVDGDKVTFRHGDCVLFNWRSLADAP
jgi:DNA-binding MarR family transcriptional regulator